MAIPLAFFIMQTLKHLHNMYVYYQYIIKVFGCLQILEYIIMLVKKKNPKQNKRQKKTTNMKMLSIMDMRCIECVNITWSYFTSICQYRRIDSLISLATQKSYCKVLIIWKIDKSWVLDIKWKKCYFYNFMCVNFLDWGDSGLPSWSWVTCLIFLMN